VIEDSDGDPCLECWLDTLFLQTLFVENDFRPLLELHSGVLGCMGFWSWFQHS
jgi:hypothetical protein